MIILRKTVPFREINFISYVPLYCYRTKFSHKEDHEMKNEIKIPVSEGTELIARAQKGNDYPGIWVYLVKDGEEVLLSY